MNMKHIDGRKCVVLFGTLFVCLFVLTHIEIGEKSPEEQERDDLNEIISLCGDLCDLTKPVTPPKEGDFMGTVTAKVNCDNLFASDILDRPSKVRPRNWTQVPEEYKPYYSHNGLVPVTDWYWDNMGDGGGMTEATVFTKETVEKRMSEWKEGKPRDTYAGGSNLVDGAAAEVGIEGKTILVIGSQDPWLEVVLLARNPKKIVTLEYGYFISEHPTWEFVRPNEFRARYVEGTLEKFDLIFIYSSVEHSGLGRYGDALNPFGDIITIARSWCVSTPEAKLAVAVPTQVRMPGGKDGSDHIQFNAHRIYGPILYPYLTTNWKFIWPTDPAAREGGSYAYQPMFVFSKNSA